MTMQRKTKSVKVSIPTPSQKSRTLTPESVREVVADCAFLARAQALENRYQSYLSTQQQNNHNNNARIRLPSFAAPWDVSIAQPRSADSSLLTDDLERRVDSLRTAVRAEEERGYHTSLPPPVVPFITQATEEGEAWAPPPDSPTTARLLQHFLKPVSGGTVNESASFDTSSIVMDPVVLAEDNGWDILLRNISHAFAPFLSPACFEDRRSEFEELYAEEIGKSRQDISWHLIYDYLCTIIEEHKRLSLDAPIATVSAFRSKQVEYIEESLRQAFPLPGGVSIVNPEVVTLSHRRSIQPYTHYAEGLLDAVLVCHLVCEVIDELK
jgi:hypothetical protein